jgi:N-acetylneuraminate synthase
MAAATLGADIVEVHVTLSREMFGPDVPVSVTTSELRELVEGVRFIEKMMAHPVNKDVMAGEMTGLRNIFSKSLVARIDLEGGTILREEHLVAKKPGSGIPIARLPEVLGTRLRRSLKADELLLNEDIERVT